MRSRRFVVFICMLLMVLQLTSCGMGKERHNVTEDSEINVITREEGSGTREAFVKIFGVVDDKGHDITYVKAEQNSSTAVVITTVKDNPSAIGFISLGTLSDDVKTVRVDGIEPTAETVKNGTYPVSRSFNVAFRKDIDIVSEDFLDFIMSRQGQEIVVKEGYIGMDVMRDYEPSDVSGTIKISGSTSVAPVVKVLAEHYEKINPNVDIQVSEGGSSAGMISTIKGVCDIGMASRDLKDSELSEGLESLTIAVDGIAVIVNKNNKFADELSSEVIKDIYLGHITKWSLEK